MLRKVNERVILLLTLRITLTLTLLEYLEKNRFKKGSFLLDPCRPSLQIFLGSTVFGTFRREWKAPSNRLGLRLRKISLETSSQTTLKPDYGCQ